MNAILSKFEDDFAMGSAERMRAPRAGASRNTRKGDEVRQKRRDRDAARHAFGDYDCRMTHGQHGGK